MLAQGVRRKQEAPAVDSSHYATELNGHGVVATPAVKAENIIKSTLPDRTGPLADSSGVVATLAAKAKS